MYNQPQYNQYYKPNSYIPDYNVDYLTKCAHDANLQYVYYNTYTNKDASILGHLGAGLGIHMIQNQAAKLLLGNKGNEEMYRHMFNVGIRGFNPASTYGKQRGLVGALVPEINVMSGLAKNFGENMEGYLKNTSHKSYTNLRPEHKEFLKDMAGGHFHKLSDRMVHPEYRELAGAYLHGSKAIINNPEYHKHIETLANAINHKDIDKGAQAAANLLKDNNTIKEIGGHFQKSYMGKIMPSMFQDLNIHETHKLSEAARSGKRYGHAIPEVASNAAIAAVDPVAGGFNVLKRFMTSETVSKIPVVNKAQSYVSNKLITRGMKNSWAAGMKGEYKEHGAIGKFLHRDVWNPLEYDINNTAGNIAQTISKSPELQIARSSNTLMDAHRVNQNTGNSTRWHRSVAYQTPKIEESLDKMGIDPKNIHINTSHKVDKNIVAQQLVNQLPQVQNYLHDKHGITSNVITGQGKDKIHINTEINKPINLTSMIANAPANMDKAKKVQNFIDKNTLIDTKHELNTIKDKLSNNPSLSNLRAVDDGQKVVSNRDNITYGARQMKVQV